MSQRAPSPSDPSILDVLQLANPSLNERWAGSSFQNTRSSSNTWDTVVSVKPWTDFTFKAVELAYGDILNRGITFADPGYIPPRPLTQTPTSIYTEDNVDTLAQAWSLNIVRHPLKAAATVLRERTGIAQAGPTPDPSLVHHPMKWHVQGTGSQPSTLKPDWVSFSLTTHPFHQGPILTERLCVGHRGAAPTHLHSVPRGWTKSGKEASLVRGW
jgi:hypothetical protein